MIAHSVAEQAGGGNFADNAGAYDFAGREAEALPHYRRALALGVPDDLLPFLYVQMGSTLRNLGAHDEAVGLLRDGVARFPAFRPLRAFLALGLHSAGRPAEALRVMLEMTLDAPDFYPSYRRALGEYAALLRD